MTSQNTTSPKGELTVLVFQVGDHHCALPVDRVAEILPMVALDRLPGMPNALEGFFNLAGALMPVVRLDRLFRLPDLAIGLYTPLIVLKGMESPLAVLVQRARSVVRVPAGELLPVSGSYTFNECVAAELQWNGETVALLDADRLLLEEEKQKLSSFHMVLADRLRGEELAA